jgi:hypothetical protein|eukprot:COSAG01_NODE_1345_length_10632_cov_648.255863_6_plen_193_part_00
MKTVLLLERARPQGRRGRRVGGRQVRAHTAHGPVVAPAAKAVHRCCGGGPHALLTPAHQITRVGTAYLCFAPISSCCYIHIHWCTPGAQLLAGTRLQQQDRSLCCPPGATVGNGCLWRHGNHNQRHTLPPRYNPAAVTAPSRGHPRHTLSTCPRESEPVAGLRPWPPQLSSSRWQSCFGWGCTSLGYSKSRP